MKQFVVVSVLFLLWGLSSCQQNKVMRSTLEGEPCQLPCWFNVHVGETKFESAVASIESYFPTENLSYPGSDSILICYNRDCSSFFTLSANSEGVIVEIVVGFAPERLLCAEIYEQYSLPDFFLDIPIEQSSIMFYDKYQIELLLVRPETRINRRWVEFMWIRENTLYTSRKTALIDSHSDSNVRMFFDTSIDFNLDQYCSFE